MPYFSIARILRSSDPRSRNDASMRHRGDRRLRGRQSGADNTDRPMRLPGRITDPNLASEAALGKARVTWRAACRQSRFLGAFPLARPFGRDFIERPPRFGATGKGRMLLS